MTHHPPPNPVEILLAEDNPADAKLIISVLQRDPVLCRVHLVEDGEKALQFLQQQGAYSKKPHPRLILLDLTLPRLGSLTVLTKIKQDPHLKHIPVIAFASPKTGPDADQAYALYANACVIKPQTADLLEALITSIQYFWLSVAKLPLSI